MKEKVIEIAGKTWRFLGQNGQTNVSQLGKALKEKDAVVLQALGWLAREDKIDYTTKNRRIKSKSLLKTQQLRRNRRKNEPIHLHSWPFLSTPTGKSVA